MKVNFEHIFEHIGFLFYAVAAEQRTLHPADYDRLKNLIGLEWVTGLNYNVDLQSRLKRALFEGVSKGFDNSMNAEEAFVRFRDYYEMHSLPFGNLLKLKIISTAIIIHTEFSDNGHSSGIIARLDKLLQATPAPLPA